MSALHRTQIYIEKEQIQRLKLEARRKHLAISALIRKAIDWFLTAKEGDIDWKNDPLVKAVGKIKLTVKDASVKHDQYLYK